MNKRKLVTYLQILNEKMAMLLSFTHVLWLKMSATKHNLMIKFRKSAIIVYKILQPMMNKGLTHMDHAVCEALGIQCECGTPPLCIMYLVNMDVS